MVAVLADPSLYAFTGGEAPNVDELQRRYAKQSVGYSEDGSQGWLNWIVYLKSPHEPIGFVQATMPSHVVADIAWVVSPAWQGQGLASEATTAMLSWLRSHDVVDVTAHIHPDNDASKAVARHHGLVPTSHQVDGEILWIS